MNTQFCQSCGMPMGTRDLYATEADGRPNEDYCKYCYEKGAFTFKGTMAEMIAICVPHMVEGNADMTAEQAHQMMTEFFPTLKRWKNS